MSITAKTAHIITDVDIPAMIQIIQKLTTTWVCAATGKKHGLNIAQGPILCIKKSTLGKIDKKLLRRSDTMVYSRVGIATSWVNQQNRNYPPMCT